tara:strand:- start:506 stop:781 length:276 start_codon:yes stop_codon:yes gene_type:complete
MYFFLIIVLCSVIYYFYKYNKKSNYNRQIKELEIDISVLKDSAFETRKDELVFTQLLRISINNLTKKGMERYLLQSNKYLNDVNSGDIFEI